MPTNENTYNSRVTSEALEKKFREVFPAQGGAELVNDLYASGVITPVIDFSSVAEGSFLGVNLQTAWDFATGFTRTTNATNNLITTPGFWLVDTTITLFNQSGVGHDGHISITDGLSSKKIYQTSVYGSGTTQGFGLNQEKFVVFVRSGDTVSQTATSQVEINTVYRQIADVNGTLVNPLGFTFS